jgi:hypothetical protein
MKRTTMLLIFPAAVLITALLLGGPSIDLSLAHQSSFNDVAETDPAHVAIESLAARQVIDGDPDGAFRPYAPLSRGEATSVLVKWRDIEIEPGSSRFPDVDPIFEPFISTALAGGWINGFPDGTFRPGDPLTRQQMITVIVRALGLDDEAVELSTAQIEAALAPYLDDGAVSETSRPYVAFAVLGDLVRGDAGRLMPGQDVTRSQLCLILYRAEGLAEHGFTISMPTEVNAVGVEPQDAAAARLSPEDQALADFMTERLFKPHNSPVTGEMVLQNAEWYGISPLAQLVIMAAETSLGDPRLGGALARNNNFGCLRYHGADTAWGKLSTGKIWVAGLDWYAFPDAQTGMMAFGRYLKTGANGYYPSLLDRPDPDWRSFAAVYYGQNVAGFGSYVNRLASLERSFEASASKHGVKL